MLLGYHSGLFQKKIHTPLMDDTELGTKRLQDFQEGQ